MGEAGSEGEEGTVCRGSHLRDVGWVTKSYQVAEERGSITEHQVQSHQPDDTCRHEERSGSGGTQALQPGSPRQHRKAWPVLSVGEKETAPRLGPRLLGALPLVWGYPAGRTFVPFLPQSLPQGAPRHAAHQLQEPRFLPGGYGEAGIPAPARGPSRPAPNSAEGLATTRYSATGTALPPAGAPPVGASSALGHWHAALGRRADTSAPAGPRPHVPGASSPGRPGRGLWSLACAGGQFCPRRRH